MEHTADKILVILTGGTICSTENADGKRYSNASHVRIIESYRKSGCAPYCGSIEFDQEMPLDILSENMTIESWNMLIRHLKTVRWNNYHGVILLHGTDTLAYTSSLLSILLAGIPVPLCLVSSQLPLDNPATNGHANFRAAVELIMNGLRPNIYALYRNSDGIMYLHYGAHLLQCANHSEDFFSKDAVQLSDCSEAPFCGTAFETTPCYLEQIDALSPCVLRILPYVGLNYDQYCLDGIRAVLHGTYHSESICVERKQGLGSYSSFSILSLLDRCRERQIPLFLEPCSETAYHYESTGDALQSGATALWGMTSEMAYCKTLIGCALGLSGEELHAFLQRSINHEMLW